MSRTPAATARRRDEVWYPETDEETVGETDFHMLALIWLRQALEDFFAARPTVYVASDLFLYYVEGNPYRNKAPDVMVVKGVSRRRRRVFLTWEEGAVPCTVFEIVSGRSYHDDTGPKVREYAAIGVKEYFLFDPEEGAYLKPPLVGYRLRGGDYAKLPPAADGSVTSRELGLVLRAEGPMLRLADARTGALILTREERAEQERLLREQERQRIEALAREVEQLRAELNRLQAARKPTRRGKKKT